MAAPAHKTVCLNRRARFDYELIEKVEAGISLLGAEAKALREGRGNLTDAYVSLERGRPVVFGLEIAPYSHDATRDRDPRRTRQLLLKAAEIRKLAGRIQEKGLTLVPLSIYFKGPWAKLELALARSKRKGDKREALRRREAERDIQRDLRRRR
jgi:SsrA-binding protein